MRKGSILQLTLLAIVFAGIAAIVALLIPWLPDPASREMGRIVFVYWLTTIICIGVFAVVAAALAYSVIHFRAKPDDDSDGPPIHGHTKLEIVWTAIPALLVTAISIASGIVVAKNDRIPKDAVKIEVTGQQFAWTFKYKDYGDVQSGRLVLPVNKPIELQIQALDVLHSFWVPDFGQKQDAVPGSVNRLKITPDRLGTYPVICTELCGLGHSVMRSEAVVMTQAGFDKWIADQRKLLAGGGSGAAEGLAVFNSNSCGGCHTFAPAKANGKIGPDLDKLPAEAKEAGKPLEEFVRESIVDPDAYVAPGFQKGTMPTTYGQLPKGQLDALVQYLSQSGKGG